MKKVLSGILLISVLLWSASVSAITKKPPTKMVTSPTSVIELNQLLSVEELAKLWIPAHVDIIWVGANTDGYAYGGQALVQPNESPLDTLKGYQAAAGDINRRLTVRRPNRQLPLPKASDYGIYGLTITDSPARTYFAFATLQKAAGGQAKITSDTGYVPDLRGKPMMVTKPVLPFRLCGAGGSSFRPDRGELEIGNLEGNTADRFIINWILWDDENSLSAFGENSTYEHETVFNNYDNHTYLGGWKRAGWNFPRGYVDTTTLDKDAERNWTIGSARAIDLNPGVWYYCWYTANPGNAGDDTAKLQSQLGHRRVSWIYSRWNIYADETQRVFNVWTIGVPCWFNWEY